MCSSSTIWNSRLKSTCPSEQFVLDLYQLDKILPEVIRHVTEEYILVSYSKYFIVFFDSNLEIFLYLKRLCQFPHSVLSIIPATTPQGEPSLQGAFLWMIQVVSPSKMMRLFQN
jgi:hypothetical protein